MDWRQMVSAGAAGDAMRAAPMTGEDRAADERTEAIMTVVTMTAVIMTEEGRQSAGGEGEAFFFAPWHICS